MKANIHPEYRQIKVKMTDGTEFMVGSTWKKKNKVMELDVDPNSHSAWQGRSGAKIQERGRVAQFMRRFKGLAPEKK